MEAKRVGGKTLTGTELGAYIRAYAALFSARRGFPEAKLLLEATSDASNRNASDAGLAAADACVGASLSRAPGGYLPPAEFVAAVDAAEVAALHAFDAAATFGSAVLVRHARDAGSADSAAPAAVKFTVARLVLSTACSAVRFCWMGMRSTVLKPPAFM